MDDNPSATDFAPVTRLTLLQAVRDDPASARWSEFYAVYRPFLARCLAKVHWVSPEDREEVVDDVFLELVRSFPDPAALPAGCRFRQYIQTKLHGKLLDKIRRNTRLSRTGAAQKVLAEHGESLPELTFEEVGERMRETLARYADWAVRAIDAPGTPADEAPEEAATLVHALLDGVFADGRFSGRSRRIFERLVFEGVSARELAAEYGMKENAVNQLRHRVVAAMKDRFRAARRRLRSGNLADLADFLRRLQHGP